MSSPSERKVSYLQLSDFAALHGVVRPLVDSGLGGPRGLAYDAAGGKLYVADPPKRRVVCYQLRVRPCEGSSCQLDYEVGVDTAQLVVVQDVLTYWVAVDSGGSLYYTDQEANSINKIEHLVLEKLASMTLNARDLRHVSEQEFVALAVQVTAAGDSVMPRGRRAALALDEALEASVVALHEANFSPHIHSPAGLTLDSTMIYWANQEKGLTNGSVAVGVNSLEGAANSEGGQTSMVSDITDVAYGVATTFNKVFFTGGENGLYSMNKADGAVALLSEGFTSPRGVVWDGDGTVYVADMGGNAIYSLPCGRAGENQPLNHVVEFHGPFGLVFIGASELQALESRGGGAADEAARSGAPHGSCTGASAVEVAVLAMVWCALQTVLRGDRCGR